MPNFENLKGASMLQNLKFAPKSPEHSQAIQEKLFSLGYKWRGGVESTTNTNKKYLYTYCDGEITQSDDDVWYVEKKSFRFN